MFCGLREEHTRFRNKKKQKKKEKTKKKKKDYRGQKWIGRDERIFYDI